MAQTGNRTTASGSPTRGGTPGKRGGMVRKRRGTTAKRSDTTAKRGGTTAKRDGETARRSGAATATARAARAIEQPKPPFPKQRQPKPGLESRMTPRPRYEAPAYRAAGKLEDRVALITGGDSGIGRAVAVLFAREGADIAFTYLPAEESDARETRRAVQGEGRRAVALAGDLSRSDFCDEIVERTVDAFGRLDIVVNNAAFQHSQDSLEKISDEQLEYTFRTNILAYFRVARAALPHLGAGSAIINTGSITGLRGSEHLLDYASTKGAIHAFTKSLAQNLAARKIRVNCVSPGPVWTPLQTSDAPPEHAAKVGKDVPMARPAQPEEIAPAFVFFASPADSSYITGEVLTLLGGETTAG